MWFQLLLAALQLVPKIVTDVQAKTPDAAGTTKKAAVLSAVNQSLLDADETLGPVLVAHPAVQQGLSTAIDVSVDLLNQGAKAAEQAGVTGAVVGHATASGQTSASLGLKVATKAPAPAPTTQPLPQLHTEPVDPVDDEG